MKIYRFRVKLEWREEVWRNIEIRGDQTLNDLHDAIQAAFNWDDDHLYAFFLSGRYWDKNTQYVSPRESNDGFGKWLQGGEKSRWANKASMDSLALSAGQIIAYIFDYGDEWRHRLKLLETCEADPEARYPRTIERHGQAPEQYPDWDEGEEEPRLSKQEILDKLGAFAPLADKVKAAIKRTDEYGIGPTELKDQYAVAMELYEAVNPEPSRLELFNAHVNFQLRHWLIPMPQALASGKLIDEAARMSLAWSEITQAENFLGDRAILLAEAGRRDEALDQARKNLEKFPEDIWAQIKAGDVHAELKDFVSAEAQYRRCLEMADDDRDYRTIQERLVPVLREGGKSEDADEIEAEERRRVQERMGSWTMPVERQTPKIGRNDSCPCGSGKKYKKCCLGKEATNLAESV